MKREEIEDKEEDKEEDKDQLSQKIKFLQDVLVDYNLQLKLIPESNKSNLFHCVSQALYFSTIYHSHFAQLCIKTLDELLSSNVCSYNFYSLNSAMSVENYAFLRIIIRMFKHIIKINIRKILRKYVLFFQFF